MFEGEHVRSLVDKIVDALLLHLKRTPVNHRKNLKNTVPMFLTVLQIRIFVPDPGSFSNPGSRTQQQRKRGGGEIWEVRDPNINLRRIPNPGPGVKKAPDSVYGSATLVSSSIINTKYRRLWRQA
jgi:hypothetical protein